MDDLTDVFDWAIRVCWAQIAVLIAFVISVPLTHAHEAVVGIALMAVCIAAWLYCALRWALAVHRRRR